MLPAMELIADRYRLDAAADAGATGRMRAWDTQAARAVVVELLPAIDDPEARARFLRDGEAISALRSPHIVPVLEVGITADERRFIVTEPVDGETMADRFASGPQPTRQMLLWGAQIADALAEAHAAGQVHCSLRPANVVLATAADGEAPVARVRDFSIEAVIDGPVEAPDAVEAPQYLPPEAWRGAYGPASDLYQLGLVLHEGLRGRPCFQGAPAELMRAHQQRTPPALSGVDAAVSDSIMRLLGKVPAGRPQKAAEVARTLRVLADAAPEGYWPAAQTNAPSIIGKVWIFTAGSLVLVLAGILLSSSLGEWDMEGSRVADAPPITFPQSTASGWILPPAAAAASREAARAAAASQTPRPKGPARLVIEPPDATVKWGDTTCTASPCALALSHPAAVRIERDGYESRTVHLMPGVELRVNLTPIDTAPPGDVSSPR